MVATMDGGCERGCRATEQWTGNTHKQHSIWNMSNVAAAGTPFARSFLRPKQPTLPLIRMSGQARAEGFAYALSRHVNHIVRTCVPFCSSCFILSCSLAALAAAAAFSACTSATGMGALCWCPAVTGDHHARGGSQAKDFRFCIESARHHQALPRNVPVVATRPS